MAQWRCNVRISWRTQIVSLLAHGALILLILISPWPEGYGPLWLVLLTLVVFECIRSQKRIATRQGELRVLSAPRHVVWDGQEWRVIGRPWMPRFGILFTLEPLDGQKRRRLWMASDCMSKADWRQLRQRLSFPPEDDSEAP
ncbi:TPA: protein YgfX [Serratia odorifera]